MPVLGQATSQVVSEGVPLSRQRALDRFTLARSFLLAHCRPKQLLTVGAAGCILLATSLLQGCGGGGGDQVNRQAAPTQTETITDAPQEAASTLTGTVAVGHAVVGATVRARCQGGQVSSHALTDAQGGFSIDMIGVRAPCMVQASGGTAGGTPVTQALHGVALSPGLVQINPITELGLAHTWGAAPASRFNGFDGLVGVPTRAVLDSTRAWLLAQLDAMGLASPTEEPFNGPFAIGDDNDQMLDALANVMRSHHANLNDLRQAAQSGIELQATLDQARAIELARQQAEEQAREAAAAAEAEADTLRGQALAAQPVTQARVTVRCAAGQPQSGTVTDSQGQFAVRLYGASLPCLIEVAGGQSGGQPYPLPLHGWVDARQSRLALVTPLSELILNHVLASSPSEAMSTFGTASTPSTSTIDAAMNWMSVQLDNLALPTLPAATLTGPLSSATETSVTSLLGRLHDKDSTLAAVLPVARQHGSLHDAIEADRAVSITFEARSGETPIACGQVIPDMGSTGASGRLMDFRFYISEAQLVREDGSLQTIKLGANTAWQHTASNGDSVTLIDLEDASDTCAEEGSTPKNALLNGSVPAGRYTGLKMTLGVPQALNHSDTAKAPAPLDSTAMGWGWQAGRKFMKVELTEATAGTWPARSATFYVHLGSTNCVGSPALGTVQCAIPNRGAIRLDNFDSRNHKVVVDLKTLLGGTNVTINQGGSGGCMSQGTDLDCLHVFEALGIAWASNGSGTGLPLDEGRTQTVFRKVSK